MTVLTTSRLQFDLWSLDDMDGFARIAKNPLVMWWIAEGAPWPDRRIAWFLGHQAALQSALGYCNWKLSRKGCDQPIGFCGLSPLAIDANRKEVEIGWWLDPRFWRQGYAHEAAVAVIEKAFDELRIPRLVARAYAGNLRSTGLIRKLGLQPAETIGEGPRGDILLFAIDRPSLIP